MKYPTAPAQPRPVRFGRVSYTDPYQWLEEESPESLDFQAQQNRLTRDWLEQNAARPRAEAIFDSLPLVFIAFPSYSGGRWFRVRTPEGWAMQIVEVADAADGPWRTVVDVQAFANGRHLSVDLFTPSPDGRKFVLGWGVDGLELAELRVFDVDSGEVLMDSIPQTYAHFTAWLPDSSGFYITGRDPAAMADGAKIYRHLLGAPATTRAETYEQTADMMWVRPAADQRHMLLIADHLNPRPDCIRDEASGDGWRPFLKGETAQFRGDIIGDRYYAVTNDGAPCGRLVSIPLATPTDRRTWIELLPGSSDVLATLLVVDGLLVLVDLVDTWSRIRVFEVDGTLKGELPLPGQGAASAFQFALFNMMDMISRGADGDVLIPFSTPARSAALYRGNVHTMQVETLVEPQVAIDAKIHSHVATSADGARVPYHVIARADVDLSRPQPTVMYGYGGFQVALIPGWGGSYLAGWIQAGGVLVLMHLRGGGELGPDMWHQGRLERKQNTFNDVHAIAEDVVARGISTREQLGVAGGSNGGTMAATVIVQRPDLYRASISQVPVTDVLARARDTITMASTLDYGDPNDPAMSEAIQTWSPYQNVVDGTRYPALLLDSGQKDLRCPPWHARKLAARMQQANRGDHPILMLVREDSGHGAASVASLRLHGIDWLTFLIDQLGLR